LLFEPLTAFGGEFGKGEQEVKVTLHLGVVFGDVMEGGEEVLQDFLEVEQVGVLGSWD
jgi:hypothetical protein